MIRKIFRGAKELAKGTIGVYLDGGLNCPGFYDLKTGKCLIEGKSCESKGKINLYHGICSKIYEYELRIKNRK